MIGESISIEVLSLKANMVRLRIAAPRTVAVHRREVYDAIRLAKRNDGLASEPNPSRAEILDAQQATVGGSLILARRVGETIMIGDSIAVDIVEARTGTVRLRVIAPRAVPVHRREVFDAIHEANQD